MKVKNKSNTKIGDKVYHITGNVFNVAAFVEGDYPIKLISNTTGEIMFVSFDVNAHGIHEYLLIKPKGSSVNAAYYHQRPDIDMDTVINSYDYNSKKWVKRYFAGWNDEGVCLIWRKGASSLTTNTEPVKTHTWCLDDDLEEKKLKMAERATKKL